MQPTTYNTSADALNALQTQEAGQKSLGDLTTAANSQFGVTGQQQTVSGLRSAIQNTTNLLNQVAPSVMGRISGSLVNNAQATKQISNEQAPISSNLNQENTNYSNAQSDLNTDVTNANQEANTQYTDQQGQDSYLQNLYNSLYQKEQDSAAAQEKASEDAEAAREFNVSQANTTAANSSQNAALAALLGGGTATATGAQMQQRSNGGFNFQDANGNAISAAEYSQTKGVPLRTLLQQMANEGDTGAKTALDYVGNDYGVNEGKVGNNTQIANLLNSILYGVNSVKVQPSLTLNGNTNNVAGAGFLQ